MKELTIRASSLPGMFDCAARWSAQNIEKLYTPTTGPAHLGTSLHAAAGMFDQSSIEGAPISSDDATDIVVDRIRNPTEEDGDIVWGSDMTQKKAIDAAVPLTLDYCENVAPRYRFTAVEVRCDPLTIDMQNGVNLTLTGQADRIRTETRQIHDNWWDDTPAPVHRFGIGDLKSGKRIIDSNGNIAIDKHVAQLGQYELIGILARNKTGLEFTLPAEIIALPTSGKHTEVVTTSVVAPSRILLGDAEHPQGLLHAAAKMAEAELFPGNPRSILCSERYCPAYAKCWWRGQE